MKSLVASWDFNFSVETQEPITHRQLEELLIAVIQWAEANSLVIGGGFHPQGEGAVTNTWQFGFGVCATLDDQLIPVPHNVRMSSICPQNVCCSRLLGPLRYRHLLCFFRNHFLKL